MIQAEVSSGSVASVWLLSRGPAGRCVISQHAMHGMTQPCMHSLGAESVPHRISHPGHGSRLVGASDAGEARTSNNAVAFPAECLPDRP